METLKLRKGLENLPAFNYNETTVFVEQTGKVYIYCLQGQVDGWEEIHP